MGSSRFGLKVADDESKSIPHEFPRSHWLKATGQCVMERYLLATMESYEVGPNEIGCDYMSVPYRTVPYRGKIQYRTIESISEFTEEYR